MCVIYTHIPVLLQWLQSGISLSISAHTHILNEQTLHDSIVHTARNFTHVQQATTVTESAIQQGPRTETELNEQKSKSDDEPVRQI
jgi:hypothetical protein